MTVFGVRQGHTVPQGGATVRAYAPGTSTPWALPLYGDEAATAPLVFPLAVGDDGEVALWADAPARVELLVEATGYLPERAVLDLELPPDYADPDPDPHPQYLTQSEGDLRYPLKTDPDPYGQYLTTAEGDLRYASLPLPPVVIPDEYLTQAEGDARYLPLSYVPPASGISQADADLRYVNTAGDTMAGALTVNGAIAGATSLYVGSSATVENYVLTKSLYADAPADTARALWLRTSGVPRWVVAAVPSAETGSNAGSDFLLGRYSDAGADLGAALTLSRATGAATFGGAVTANGLVQVHRAAAGDLALETYVGAQTSPRFQIIAGGNMGWGTGNAAPDVTVFRSTGGTLAVTAHWIPSGTRELGRSTARWNGIYGNTIDAATALNVVGLPVAVSPTAGNALTWDATGLYAPAGGGGGISQADADLRYVNTAGDTLTGALVGPDIRASSVMVTPALYVQVAGEPIFQIDAPASNRRRLVLSSSGSNRWELRATNLAETGSNAGSDLELLRYSDAAADLGPALSISRATGAATFGGPVTTGSPLTISGASANLGLAGAASSERQVKWSTGAVSRWGLGTYGGDNETGAGAGGNLRVARYDDAGAFVGTALELTRATGAAVFGGALSAPSVTATSVTATGSLAASGAGAELRLNDRDGSGAWVLYNNANTLRLFDLADRFTFDGTGRMTGTAVALGTTTAAAGAVRLANAGTLAWRNAANTADLTLGVDASDRLALAVGAGSLTTSATAGGGHRPARHAHRVPDRDPERQRGEAALLLVRSRPWPWKSAPPSASRP